MCARAWMRNRHSQAHLDSWPARLSFRELRGRRCSARLQRVLPPAGEGGRTMTSSASVSKLWSVRRSTACPRISAG